MAVLYFAIVVDLIGVGIIIPLLPFYAQAFGASPFDIALLAAIFSLVQFLAAPVLGRLSDRHGRRPVFMACLGVSALAYLGLAFADELWLIFAMRALGGLGAGKITVANAIVVDITPPERRAKNLGRLSSAFGIGMIAGPVIGGLLSGDPANPDFHRPMFAAAALSLIAIVLAFFTVKETLRRDAPRGETIGLARRWMVALTRPGLRPVLLVFLAFHLVFAMLIAMYALWMQHAFAWGPREVSVMFGFVGVIVLLVQGFGVEPIVRRLGERLTLGCGLGATAIGLLGTPWALDLGAFAAMTALTSIGVSLVGPAASAMASHRASADQQGLVLGVMQSAASLGQILGPPLAGWLFGAFSPAAPYHVGGVMLTIAIAMFYGFHQWRRQ